MLRTSTPGQPDQRRVGRGGGPGEDSTSTRGGPGAKRGLQHVDVHPAGVAGARLRQRRGMDGQDRDPPGHTSVAPSIAGAARSRDRGDRCVRRSALSGLAYSPPSETPRAGLLHLVAERGDPQFPRRQDVESAKRRPGGGQSPGYSVNA